MNELQDKIFRKFRAEPGKELSTTEVVSDILPADYRLVKEVLSGSNEKARLVMARRKKGQLHRKALYYLNKLVLQENLTETKRVGKGEKYFVLNVNKNRDATHSISAINPVTPIEGYEEFVKKFDGEAWLSRANAAIVDASKIPGLFKLQATILDLFGQVNDAVAICGFEKVLAGSDNVDWEAWLRTVNIEAKDYNREVALHVAVDAHTAESIYVRLSEIFTKLKPEKVKIFWSFTSIESGPKLVSELISIFLSSGEPFYVNSTSAPFFLGKGGTYTIDCQEWETFRKCNKSTVICASCSLVIDFKKFQQQSRSVHEFRAVLRKAAKALFIANWRLRDVANQRDSYISADDQAVLWTGEGHIRLWNFPLKGEDGETFVMLLGSCKSEMERFVRVQETIFKSCGMPLRFRLILSAAEGSFSKKQSCWPVTEYVLDASKPAFESQLVKRERLNQLFSGRECVKFLSRGSPETVFQQVKMVLSRGKIPLMAFIGKGTEEEVKLSYFLR